MQNIRQKEAILKKFFRAFNFCTTCIQSSQKNIQKMRNSSFSDFF